MGKPYSELEFTDDFMFWNVLVMNPELCKELLELILNISIREIRLVEGQKSIEHKYDRRGIRLDVYVNDNVDTVYDLEMQTTINKELAKRMRYYQGMIDLNLIQRGERFSKLKKSYIIFLCTGDPFRRHLPIYSFKNVCVQDTTLVLNDETVKIVINPDSDRTNLSPEMNSFLDLLQGKQEVIGLAGKLQNAVDEVKKHEELEVEYMTMHMKLLEEREEGRAEGLVKGLEEGRAEGRAEGLAEGQSIERESIIKRLLLSGKTLKAIAELCGYEIEEVIAVQNKISQTVSE